MALAATLSPEDLGIFRKAIVDLPTAKAFVDMLHRNDLMFHFEDSLFDIIWDENKHSPNVVDLLRLDKRRNELYQPHIDWSHDGDCPIGFALICMGHTDEGEAA